MCGNGIVEGDEDCDGTNLNGKTCATVGTGYTGGVLKCNTSTCKFDLSGCTGYKCGDSFPQGDEQCDCGPTPASPCAPIQLQNKTCADYNSPKGTPYTGGTLGCNSGTTCTYIFDNCQYCGNNKIEAGEQCDGTDLAGQKCTNFGYLSGTLSCDSACKWNTSACSNTPPPSTECRNGLYVAITDNIPAGVSDVINLSSTSKVKTVTVDLVINHARPGDLVVKLTHGATTVTLLNRPGMPMISSEGCKNANISCTFSDSAGPSAHNTCATTPPAISGTLKPAEVLSAFVGATASGAWNLNVSDHAVGQMGTLVSWCLNLEWE